MQLIVCTSNGDIMLVNHSGEFLQYLHFAQTLEQEKLNQSEGAYLNSIFAYSQGFVVGGENGHIWTFAG